jgi:hypothetical protein
MVVQEGIEAEVMQKYREIFSGINLGTECGIIVPTEWQQDILTFTEGDCLKVEVPARFLVEDTSVEDQEIVTKIKSAIKLTQTEPVVILELPLDFLLESRFKIGVL